MVGDVPEGTGRHFLRRGDKGGAGEGQARCLRHWEWHVQSHQGAREPGTFTEQHVQEADAQVCEGGVGGAQSWDAGVEGSPRGQRGKVFAHEPKLSGLYLLDSGEPGQALSGRVT